MAIQDDNTILMKSDLKAYHEAIAPMLGGSFMLSTNVGDYYSTDEKIIGVWTDGKPLYQKTFVSTLPTLTTTGEVKKDITIGASVDNIVNIYGCFNYYNTNNMIIIPYNSDIGSVYLFGRPNNTGTTTSKNTIGITANPKTVDAASRLSENTIVFTVLYTKTTDTTSTALTTPGAYDINFPNTWPENKEIFFGNGLYGFRATGNMPALAAGTDWTNIRMLTNIGTNGKTFQMGGGLESLNANEVRAWTQLGISRSSNFESTLVVSTTGELQLGVRFPGTAHHSKTTNKYDVWVTYTK